MIDISDFIDVAAIRKQSLLFRVLLYTFIYSLANRLLLEKVDLLIIDMSESLITS